MENITSKYLINGPNNVVRLTDGTKILYIFGDYHHDLDYQNECNFDDKYDSIDIDKFLLKFIKTEKEKEFDLFIENSDLNPLNKNIYRDIYIRQVIKLFNSQVIIKNNKIIINKKYKNFRFHFFDIRESIPFWTTFINNYWSYYLNLNKYFIDNILENAYSCDLLKFLNLNDGLIKELNLYIEYINNNENIYINKIKNNYKNLKIKNIINKIFNNVLILNIKNSISNLENLNLYIDKNIDLLNDKSISDKRKSKILLNIYKRSNKYTLIIFKLSSVLTDLYFLRRFLDKDYIKNGILYTGIGHMCNIIFILTKYFNYKITNIYYKNDDFKLDSIIKLKTKNLKYISIIQDYLENKDEKYNVIQCINLFSFPSNFS